MRNLILSVSNAIASRVNPYIPNIERGSENKFADGCRSSELQNLPDCQSDVPNHTKRCSASSHYMF